MKKIFTVVLLIAIIAGCKKEEDSEPIIDENFVQKNIINDFANVVVNPNYSEIAVNAGVLQTSIQNFISLPTDSTLIIARSAWRTAREPWEKSEAYLFGPVEDFNYDPEMDTWPLNTTDIDALLAGSNPLNVADIDSLPTSLKGFHAIEYMLFGIGGVKTAAQFTPRETQYLLSLSENLHNITISLQNSWLSGGFTSEWTSAGAGSTRFPTRRDAFIALVTAMAGICEEVGEGKIADPFLAQDSTLEESRFSHNSTTDFRNNMIGVSNAYYGNYVLDGAGLNGLVRIKNASLDLKIQSQLTAVINSFNNIDPNFGLAIYTQQGQIMDLQTKIDALKETLETELIPWINVWVTQ